MKLTSIALISTAMYRGCDIRITFTGAPVHGMAQNECVSKLSHPVNVPFSYTNQLLLSYTTIIKFTHSRDKQRALSCVHDGKREVI